MATIIKEHKPQLKAPLGVCIWISDACNLACKYCYAWPFSGKMMEKKRLFEIIEELVNLQVFSIVLAGGEPFLHPDIFEIIEFCTYRNVQLGVLSNATLIDKELTNKLSKIVKDKKFILQVSLDSPDPKINDKTRDKGIDVVKNLINLTETDIGIQIATVVTKYNLKTAHKIIEKFYPKVKRYHFLNVQRTQKALLNPDILLSEDEVKMFWVNLKEYVKGFPKDLFVPSLKIMLKIFDCEDSNEVKMFNKRASFHCKACAVGLTYVNIDSDFNLLGCDIAKDFVNMGNLRNTSFETVWNSEQAFNVRNSDFPPCYKNRDPQGIALEDFLDSDFIANISRPNFLG